VRSKPHPEHLNPPLRLPIGDSKAEHTRLTEPPGTDTVIILTRLGNGLPIAVNPDLIERAEHTPDTVVTLVDGHKLVVEEPVDEVIALVRAWRASVAAEALTLARMADQDLAHTSRLPHPRTDLATATELAAADQNTSGSSIGQVLHLPHRGV
jgi:flagellar protein FlbD